MNIYNMYTKGKHLGHTIPFKCYTLANCNVRSTHIRNPFFITIYYKRNKKVLKLECTRST